MPQININMSQTTVQALTNGGFSLYGFKAVQTMQSGGAPTIWFSSSSYLVSTQVSWDDVYEAYTSSTAQIATGVQINVLSSAGIGLGQILSVAPDGLGVTLNGGPPNVITIQNQAQLPYVCGVSQAAFGTGTQPMASPVCAFPVLPFSQIALVPLEKVLLMFASTPLNAGTVISQAMAQGIFVDLTSGNQAAVMYDINFGWSTQSGSGQVVPTGANLVPLLIEQ